MEPTDRRALRLLAMLSLISTAWFAAQALFGEFLPRAADWALLCAGQALTLPTCWRAGTSPTIAPAARRFWRTVTYALTAMGVGLAIRLAGSLLGLSWTPAGQVAHFTGVALILGGLTRMPITARGQSGRRALVLDFAITLTAAAIFVWHVADPRTLSTTDHQPPMVIFFLMAAMLAGVLITAKVVLTGSDVLSRGAMQMIGMACLTGALGSTLGGVLGNRPGVNSFLLTIPWAGGLMALAARRQLVDVAEGGTATGRRPNYSLLPYAAVAAVCGLLLYVIATGGNHRLMVAIGTASITALVVLRQFLSFRDNESLISRLDDSLLELQHEEERFRLLVQNSTDIVTIAEPDFTIRYVSPAIERVLGRDPADQIGSTIGALAHPDDLDSMRAAVAHVLHTPGSTSVAYAARYAHADGSWRWLELITSNLTTEPSIGGIVTNARDITETRAVQEKLSFEASHDVLTGLANRALFNDRVARSVADTRADHRLSLVLIDLDDFKQVNDTLGHAAGDALLVAVADRLRASVRPGDTVARLGGDEFAILFEGLAGDDVDRVLVRIAEALLVPVPVEEQLLSVRASFGVVDGRGGSDAGNLLRQADIAMYEAKERGEGGHQRYTPGMEARGAERSRLNSALREALDNDELVLHFQSVVSLPEGRPTGAEALLRWQHPVRGLLEPADFLPGAEQNGLILPIGHWVLRTACRQFAAWRAEHGAAAPESVSVNVSLRELQEPGFTAAVADALRSFGLPAARLTLEITETAAAAPGAARHTVQGLRDLGVRLALDHFGTGTSTLTLLAACPVDEIKLDRSYAAGSDALPRAAVQLAGALGVRAVATGVETAEQADRLHDLGYRLAQGFHFARPVPAAELEATFTALSSRS